MHTPVGPSPPEIWTCAGAIRPSAGGRRSSGLMRPIIIGHDVELRANQELSGVTVESLG